MDTVSFLSLTKIKSALPDKKRALLKSIEIFQAIDSTNTYLLGRIHEHAKIPRACFAEVQLQGRGRLNRAWHSPFAQNLYVSILWKFNTTRTDFQGLSLVVAVAISDVLTQLSLPKPVQLKWPNDIFIDGKKCGGILIETRGDVRQGVVIGVGLNVNMQQAKPNDISQSWVSLSQLLGKTIDRNPLAAALIDRITDCLEQFDQQGFAPFKALWEKYDMTFGQSISMTCHNKKIAGIAQGIDDCGRLNIKNMDGTVSVVSVGDVMLGS
jgi:BirA family biotin operon repressor/biotin-[acetyl-CoA-carboxylase] ligase